MIKISEEKARYDEERWQRNWCHRPFPCCWGLLPPRPLTGGVRQPQLSHHLFPIIVPVLLFVHVLILILIHVHVHAHVSILVRIAPFPHHRPHSSSPSCSSSDNIILCLLQAAKCDVFFLEAVFAKSKKGSQRVGLSHKILNFVIGEKTRNFQKKKITVYWVEKSWSLKSHRCWCFWDRESHDLDKRHRDCF